MEGANLPSSFQTTQPHEDKYGCHRFVTEPDLGGIFRARDFLYGVDKKLVAGRGFEPLTFRL